jgi:carbon starvation protein
VGWGYFLIQGVRDPLGGINSLWPLFGIANQMLAAIALCLGTTIILKMTLVKRNSTPAEGSHQRPGPALALVTLLPLTWLLAVTMTAGVQKIFHTDPRIGFLAQAQVLKDKLPALQQALVAAQASGNLAAIEAANKALKTNRIIHFNNLLDAVVAGGFLVLVALIALLSLREWILLLARRKLAVLRESDPVWLPDYAVAESRPLNALNLLALAFALLKELSGEASLDRAKQQATLCECDHPKENHNAAMAPKNAGGDKQLYVEVTERRFNGVTRCC